MWDMTHFINKPNTLRRTLYMIQDYLYDLLIDNGYEHIDNTEDGLMFRKIDNKRKQDIFIKTVIHTDYL